MQQLIRIPLALATLLLAAGAFAHHSVAGQFDSTRRVTVTGVVTKIDWINPHIYIHLSVTEDSGEVTTWRLASLPTAMLRKAGLTQDMIRGDGGPVTAEAILARNGTANLAWVTKLSYSDGHYYQLAGE